MPKYEMKTIIENHAKWLEDNSKGERAELSGIDLSGIDFRFTDLRYCNIRGANFTGANFTDTNLRGANLSRVDLSFANLREADLRGDDLYDANLRGANLSRADLHFATLNEANFNGTNLTDANLNNINAWNTIGNGKEIKSFQTEKYTINIINDEMVQIGSEQHSFDDWMKFDDNTFDQIDVGALDWWKTWKPKLKVLLDI